ncbi:MAG: GMC family oxidoreductase [Planctomycetes bacterium]|nr:GMC family oxidoreductase [Planctomycetota bacterium]
MKGHVNAIVVGSGAGGGCAAKELAEAGMSVVLFERGGWVTLDDHDHDELISQRTSVLGNAHGPDNERYRRVRVSPDGKSRIVLPNDYAYGNIAATVGSGTVSYGAMGWRFMPEDFKMKTTYGHVEGSTLDDWPITYEDMEPFYEKAEWEVGVSGDDSKNPFGPPRKKDFPMPPFPLNREGKLLHKTAKKMGLNPFPIPMLRNSVSYEGRPKCYKMRTCVGFACPVNAKNGSHNTVIPAAIATGNCELRINCQVVKITQNSKGHLTGIEYYDDKMQKQTQTADVIVLAASATETPRLMFNSASKHHPNGIGNRYDWLGRNLQGHAYCGAQGIFENETFDDRGSGACVAISDYNHHNPGIIGGAVLANEFTRLPYMFSKIRPPKSPRWGLEHKKFQAKNYKRLGMVMGPYQEIPSFKARVDIDPKVKDAWGMPVARLSGHGHPRDFEGTDFLSKKAEEWLIQAGAVETWRKGHHKHKRLSGGVHQAGTCRMGKDPQSSVCDKYCRVHETSNLFIADGSPLVTNGGFNPALTIMANGFRVGDYIAKEWKNGNKFKA